MRKSRLPLTERLELLRKIKLANKLKLRKLRFLNSLFRKSKFYIFTLSVRIVFAILFVVVVSLYQEIKNETPEEVQVFNVEYKEERRKWGITHYAITTLITKDTKVSYGHSLKYLFKPGDTVLICPNYFGKPVYFRKPTYQLYYPVQNSLPFYFMPFLVTLISFFFNDAFDSFSKPLMLSVAIVDLLVIAWFFLF